MDHTKGRYGIAHELGHNLGLDHGGTAAACVQNGKPNYRSIMNYAAEKMGAATFSLGSSEWTPLAPLNPVFLYENDGLKTPDFADIQYLQNAPFHYYVAKGPNEPYWGVDWNRDGVISGHDHEIRAAPNYQKDVQGSPELGRYYYYTKKHSAFAAANADGASTPSLVRIRQAQGSHDNTILVYRTASGEIKWLRQPGGGFQCPNLYEGCLYWQSATVSSSSDPGGPVAAVQIFQPNPSHYGSELLIVVWKENGGLKYKMYDSQLSELVPATDVPDSQGVVYEPSLAYYGWAGLMLVYLKGEDGQTGTVYANFMPNGTTSFSAAAVQTDMSAQPLQVTSVLAAASHPAGMRAAFSYLETCVPSPQNPCLYTTYYPTEWFEYRGSNQWERLTGTGIETNFVPRLPKHRAGLTYLAHPPNTGLSGGRWYMIYNALQGNDPTKPGVFRIDMTRGDGVDTNPALVWENRGRYDNQWFDSLSGAALLGWRPGLYGVPVTEENLRFGYVYDGDGAELEFRPFADGIVNVELKDNNDWATMGRSGGICSGLVLAQPGGPVSQCPSAP